MRLVLYVHEFVPEVGHSHAMIETLKNFPPGTLKSLKVVAFQSSPLNELFPGNKIELSNVNVPFPNIAPFLIKMIFFQIYAFLYSWFCVGEDETEISIGIAHLFPDVVNIQFLHYQWKEHYFKTNSLSFFKKIYKQMLFMTFTLGEYFVYSNQRIKIFALSRFIQQGLIEKFNRNEENTCVIYSGINYEKFAISILSRVEILKLLSEKHPVLSKLNPELPISLFVGAFERKGLPCLIERLKKDLKKGDLDLNYQFIVIGKPEVGSRIDLNFHSNIFHIPFSRDLPLFYSIADQFLFPTIYEPFGLVLIEAAAMGLEVHTLKSQVGAAEILDHQPGIFISKNQNSFEIPKPRFLTNLERQNYRQQRMKLLLQYSWIKNGQDCYHFISKSS